MFCDADAIDVFDADIFYSLFFWRGRENRFQPSLYRRSVYLASSLYLGIVDAPHLDCEDFPDISL